jgi:putative proteasome-type protease
VEITESTPYSAIGESSYGKPLLDRALNFESTMELALKVGYLAFEATRSSATDVDFPIDVVLYHKGSLTMDEIRYDQKDMVAVSEWWKKRVRETVELCPSEWVKAILEKKKGLRAVEPGA